MEMKSSEIFQNGVNNLSKVECPGSIFRSSDVDSTSIEKGSLEMHPKASEGKRQPATLQAV